MPEGFRIAATMPTMIKAPAMPTTVAGAANISGPGSAAQEAQGVPQGPGVPDVFGDKLFKVKNKAARNVLFGNLDKRFFTLQSESIALGDVPTKMSCVDCQGSSSKGDSIPEEFGGVFWQDGIPTGSPERVMSYGQSRWTAGKRGCNNGELFFHSLYDRAHGQVSGPKGDTVPCLGMMSGFAFDDRMWAYDYGMRGKGGRLSSTVMNMQVSYVCGGQHGRITVCKVGPQKGSLTRLGLKVGALAWPMVYWMVQVEPDLWVRYSKYPITWGSGIPMNPLTEGEEWRNYYLKRIVNCDGTYGKYWNQFISNGVAKIGVEPTEDSLGRTFDPVFRNNPGHTQVVSTKNKLVIRVSRRGATKTCRAPGGPATRQVTPPRRPTNASALPRGGLSRPRGIASGKARGKAKAKFNTEVPARA